MESLEEYVKVLIRKAAETDKAVDALQLSQAACNVVNALVTLKQLNKYDWGDDG